ncbi:Hypothetical predicted protein [Olea europaea subsp. europaea]|uniref:Uncharacterized protein n=1 Tax=Olea europaea subsp. europaea TaxID=158383 RepID=A0A8S0T068_OLEEU|nr:Hypothetical predicted protein [Olea europaea subsp. europaea]
MEVVLVKRKVNRCSGCRRKVGWKREDSDSAKVVLVKREVNRRSGYNRYIGSAEVGGVDVDAGYCSCKPATILYCFAVVCDGGHGGELQWLWWSWRFD